MTISGICNIGLSTANKMTVLPLPKLFIVNVFEHGSLSNRSSVCFLQQLYKIQSNCTHIGKRHLIVPLSPAHSFKLRCQTLYRNLKSPLTAKHRNEMNGPHPLINVTRSSFCGNYKKDEAKLNRNTVSKATPTAGIKTF